MEIVNEFESVKKIVRELLETEPRTRNSDKFLIFRIMQKFTNIETTFEEFNKMPCFETIRRMRQKLQEENQNLKANEVTQDFRNERESQVKRILKEDMNEFRPVIPTFINTRTHGVEVFSR